ncbi:MAG: tRNA lysidine(34) synthetase TilS [Nitrospirota bacterium]|nr:tRNA lysidine(34) synthetase TilS [Nitrospirota bacterium]
MFRTLPFRFERQVLDRARAQELIQPGDRVLVAVSGGPDSVALFGWLGQCRSMVRGLTLGVVHIHHGLRGDEADQDAEFVERLSQHEGLPFFLRKVSVLQTYHDQKGQSLQAVARRERYRAFVDVAEKFHATKIALGHTQDDQAETVMMWMLRGAGATGLAGMAHHRPPLFIRPFLGVSRRRILEYLEQRGISYRMDSSNANPRYLRNRIRQQLIPVLKQFNPNILGVLSRQSDILREETQYLEQVAESALDSVKLESNAPGIALQRREFLRVPQPIQRRVVMKVFRAMWPMDFNPPYELVEALLVLMRQGRSGTLLRFKGITVVRDYDTVLFTNENEHVQTTSFFTEVHFPVPGSMLWPNTKQCFHGEFVSPLTCSIHSDPLYAYFDGDQFSNDLVIRTWKPGDYFCPFGLGGRRKKVQDFFSDIKLSRSKRAHVPLLVAPEGILWIGGFRSDHRFRVTDTTQRILTVHLSTTKSAS